MEIIERFTAPTKYDAFKFGQIIKILNESELSIDYYIQCNENENNPQWMRVGDFLEKNLMPHNAQNIANILGLITEPNTILESIFIGHSQDN